MCITEVLLQIWESHCIFVWLLKCLYKCGKALTAICFAGAEDTVKTFPAVIRGSMQTVRCGRLRIREQDRCLCRMRHLQESEEKRR